MSDILLREQLPPMERWKLEDVAAARPTRVGGARSAAAPVQKPHTAAELEALQKQAWDESYARGLEEGRKAGVEEGREAGRAEIAREVARLGRIVQEMATPLAEIDDEVEGELVQLALAVARQIIRRELSVDPSHVIAAVREALAELPSSSRDIRVILNPDDAQLVREALSQPSGTATWELVEDPVIEHGGCRVISPNTTVDASLETRIRAVAARVLGGERDDDFEGETPPPDLA